MKNIKNKIAYLLAGVLFVCVFMTTAFKTFSKKAGQNILTNNPVKSENNPEKPGFAVVELFTSEGCSSCPPADRLIAQIQKETINQPVYIMAFHVDYWDRLGWKDKFSSSAFSARQSQYSRWLGLKGVYTPQIVVNGKKQFVGSNEKALRAAIKPSVETVVNTELILNDLQFANNKLSLKYLIKNFNSKNNTSLIVALVEKTATTKILSGENEGRTINHINVVRSLQKVQADKTNGMVFFSLPKSVSFKNIEVIAFLQNNANGEINVASKIN